MRTCVHQAPKPAGPPYDKWWPAPGLSTLGRRCTWLVLVAGCGGWGWLQLGVLFPVHPELHACLCPEASKRSAGTGPSVRSGSTYGPTICSGSHLLLLPQVPADHCAGVPRHVRFYLRMGRALVAALVASVVLYCSIWQMALQRPSASFMAQHRVSFYTPYGLERVLPRPCFLSLHRGQTP